ncbi:MAG TPA: DUF3089 domain-containing protein [Allosphingosinicella sp.]|jgi:hypothetical protein|nr:DUF3089 domain-containing protein [Allosphingosinicella sp.]
MKKAILLLLVLLGAAPGHAQQAAPPALAPAIAAPADYADSANWLCLPGRDDACSRPLPTTTLGPNGYGAAVRHAAAANPPADCFYVYPTVSRDPGFNSDLSPGAEEQAAVAVQLARFSQVCRTFAPVYRSGTVSAIGAMLRGQDPVPIFALAYGDVRAAWHYYLAHHNNGRPVVLIGHSQGSIHLIELLKSEIEGRPVARRLLSALIIGFNVEVPEGRLTGGTFRSLPLCTRAGQIGCVVTYVSFRAESPPPEGALFGRAAAPGNTVACTNPAALGSDARAPLDSYWFSSPATRSDIAWSSTGPPPTPFLQTPGLVSGACVHRGPLGYFAVTVNAVPADARTDRIPGDVVIFGVPMPGWGIHPADVNLTQGDLIRLVAAQEAAWARRRR